MDDDDEPAADFDVDAFDLESGLDIDSGFGTSSGLTAWIYAAMATRSCFSEVCGLNTDRLTMIDGIDFTCSNRWVHEPAVILPPLYADPTWVRPVPGMTLGDFM